MARSPMTVTLIREVLDVIMLVFDSDVTTAKRPSGQLLGVWRWRAFDLVGSEHILSESAEILEGRYFKKHLTSRERQGDCVSAPPASLGQKDHGHGLRDSWCCNRVCDADFDANAKSNPDIVSVCVGA